MARLPLLKTEKRVLVTLSSTQIRALLAFRPKGFAQHRVHALACLLLDTGLRVDEGLRLRPSDVDWDNLLVTVYGKGQKERRLPFSHEMRKLLYRGDQPCGKAVAHNDRMFPARNGGQWQQRNSLRSLYLLQERVGLPKFGWHRLRHSFATEYLRNGGEVVRLSRILGRTQVTTTMKYLHLLTEDLQGPHSRLSPLGRQR